MRAIRSRFFEAPYRVPGRGIIQFNGPRDNMVFPDRADPDLLWTWPALLGYMGLLGLLGYLFLSVA